MSDEESQTCGAEAEINQITGEAVCNSLNRGAGFFSPFDRIDELAERGVAAYMVNAHF